MARSDEASLENKRGASLRRTLDMFNSDQGTFSLSDPQVPSCRRRSGPAREDAAAAVAAAARLYAHSAPHVHRRVEEWQQMPRQRHTNPPPFVGAVTGTEERKVLQPAVLAISAVSGGSTDDPAAGGTGDVRVGRDGLSSSIHGAKVAGVEGGQGGVVQDKARSACRNNKGVQRLVDMDEAAELDEDGADSQVESRTPPAMERNLFLSALANGKLAYHRDDVIMTLKRVVAGGLAGMLAKSVVAPVDRAKILFQVTNEKFSFNKAEKLLRDILRLEGPAGLWKGNSATMLRVFPYAGTQFMMFDTLKRFALIRKTRHNPNAEQRLSNMESLLSGSFAGAISALVTYPLDLARARLAIVHSRKIDGKRMSMGVGRLLRTVVREDGFLALYRGVTPSLLGIIPYAGIAFSINEQAKHEVLILTGKEPATMHKLGIGAFAGLVAQSCTYPLEVTRRRMQTCGHVDTHAGVRKVFEAPQDGVHANPQITRRLNIFQTLKAVIEEQGARGLFKGLSMNWVKGPVGISISFTTFDFLKKRFGIA